MFCCIKSKGAIVKNEGEKNLEKAQDPIPQAQAEHQRTASVATIESEEHEVLKCSSSNSLSIGADAWAGNDPVTLYANNGRRNGDTQINGLITKNHKKLSESIDLNESISLVSFFSTESEDEAKRRRSDFRYSYNVRKSIALDEDEQELQNKVIDWSSKYETTRRIRHMCEFFSSPRKNNSIEKQLAYRRWLGSLAALDPRRQIHLYFTEVARVGGPLANPLAEEPMSIISGFRRASSFSVWRPTSCEAISLMMKEEATGKGLKVKGKSAKKGVLSGLIPFVQIHEEKHKLIGKLGLSRDGRIQVYYKSKALREYAVLKLMPIIQKMKEQEDKWNVHDYGVFKLNNCGYGINVAERVFYEACILRQDISRAGELETGRPSEPNFLSMNFESTRTYNGVGPRTVVFQLDNKDPLKPQTLVIAYEENERVIPVCSDFDCFTVGTRGVVYDEPIANEQVDLMKWMIESIVKILGKHDGEESWASCWFEVLKELNKSRKMKTPPFGFGDPKSYKIMEGAVTRFAHNKNGAVRHGAECFNYKWPQEIDDKLLVIADSGDIDGTKRPFKYMTPEELQEFMLKKIDDGYIFPLSPKWIVADVGWKRVYDKLISKSNANSNTQTSLEAWYPESSGVREMIEKACEIYPGGFIDKSGRSKLEGTESVDLMKQKLRRTKILKSALLKIKVLRTLQSNFCNHSV